VLVYGRYLNELTVFDAAVREIVAGQAFPVAAR
jgi:hypothetical protein